MRNPTIAELVNSRFSGAAVVQAQDLLTELGQEHRANDRRGYRIQCAAIRVSEGDSQKLERAVALARLDWRDLLMGADFGHDVDAHLAWAREVVASD